MQKYREYVPICPSLYVILMEVYMEAMTASIESCVWKCEVADGVFNTILSWKREHIIPKKIVRNFYFDILAVVVKTHSSIEKCLMRPQIALRTSIQKLLMEFKPKKR